MNTTTKEKIPAKLNNMSGLAWDSCRQRWKVRLCVNLGSHFVGKRIQVNLPSSDVETAIASRDAMMKVLCKLGLELFTRRQRRPRCKRVKPVLMLPAPVVEIESEPEPPQMAPNDPRRWGPPRGRE